MGYDARSMKLSITGFALAAVLAAGCQKDSKLDHVSGSAAAAPGAIATAGATAVDIDSKDILARDAKADRVEVKHVLIGWKDLSDAYGGHLDARAAKRTEAEAAALAQDIAKQLRANPDQIDALIQKYSEDPGSVTGQVYVVRADAPMVPEFKQLALRLKEKEIGIVRSQFGFHVMERMAPDPLQSNDVLARAPEQGPVSIQRVLIRWKDVPAAKERPLDPAAQNRTKAQADQLAKQVLDQIRAGGDMAALMKQYSEDPTSKDTAKVITVPPTAPSFDSLVELSRRLKVGEAGIILSPLGWDIVKRVPPPPPPPLDPLESADILARAPVTQKAKVKHILLGWTDAHTPDPRGAKRDRATLEKLVKATVAKLKAGAKIEPLMAQLSEDPGSAKSGQAYDVTPNGGMVEPFEKLSLRLKVGEVGVVKTQFGIHIIERVE
jgi:parvulin-like peptidyl-prolyl isomerase